MKAEEFIESIVSEHDGYVKKEDAVRAIRIARESGVKKWSLWCFNFSTPFERVICSVWGGTLSYEDGRYCCRDNHFTQHLIEKWHSFENRGDARMLFFYCELDSSLKKQLVDWVMDNYKG